MASNSENPAKKRKASSKATSTCFTNAKKSKSILGTSHTRSQARSVSIESIHTEEEDEKHVENLIQRKIEGEDELWEDENEEEETDEDDKAELSESFNLTPRNKAH
jgi:uncharacterized protein (DUF1501 family)